MSPTSFEQETKSQTSLLRDVIDLCIHVDIDLVGLQLVSRLCFVENTF